MACNCGKKNNQPRRRAVVPNQANIVSSRNVRGNNVQAQSVEGLDATRRAAERQSRRQAIFKKLGRI